MNRSCVLSSAQMMCLACVVDAAECLTDEHLHALVQRVYIPLPELAARAHMFKVHLGDTPNALTQADFEALAAHTDGFSGSDVNVVVKDVLMEPVRKTQEATHFRCVLCCTAYYWHPWQYAHGVSLQVCI